MRISIKGGTKSQKKYVRSITKFCVKKLMTRMDSLELNIRIRSFGKANEDCYGYCLATDDADPARPREFNIDVNSKLKLRLLLETVAHELVHVKQFARGELYQSSVTMKHRWQGKWYKRTPSYWNQPWEWEAAGREAGLFVQWCEAERIGHLKWTQENA
tara:strand:+ start:1434 stop:1910 length:477 start_codon:yes stop_codon:yes gene_type:complete